MAKKKAVTNQVQRQRNRQVQKPKEDAIAIDGLVLEVIKDEYKVQLDIENEKGEQPIVAAHVSGKMRMHMIRILPGDKVTVEFSPYDLTRGRITYRK